MVDFRRRSQVLYCNILHIFTIDVAVINHYKELYNSSTRFCDDDNYALGHIREYIDLVFMIYRAKKTEQHLRYATKLRHGGNIDEAACKAHFSNVSKEKKLSRIFELTNPFIFIFEGAPGIGKSMVARQIAYEWANGKILHNIELLLLLKF